jgi:hypothetical protein
MIFINPPISAATPPTEATTLSSHPGGRRRSRRPGKPLLDHRRVPVVPTVDHLAPERQSDDICRPCPSIMSRRSQPSSTAHTSHTAVIVWSPLTFVILHKPLSVDRSRFRASRASRFLRTCRSGSRRQPPCAASRSEAESCSSGNRDLADARAIAVLSVVGPSGPRLSEPHSASHWSISARTSTRKHDESVKNYHRVFRRAFEGERMHRRGTDYGSWWGSGRMRISLASRSWLNSRKLGVPSTSHNSQRHSSTTQRVSSACVDDSGIGDCSDTLFRSVRISVALWNQHP